MTAACPRHPRFAADETCPRCGAFVCSGCARARGLPCCVACAALPSVQRERLRMGAHRIAWLPFGSAIVFGLFVAGAAAFLSAQDLQAEPEEVLLGGALLMTPYLVVGALQWLSTHWWPSALGVAYSLAMLFVTVELGCLTIPCGIAIGLGILHLFRLREALLTPSEPPAAP